MRLTWPLTGRTGLTRQIEAALVDSASAGIVVSGSAGVGKSRIARDALTSFGARGWRVHWVVGTSAARRLPLGALTPWARSSGNDSLQLVHDVVAALTTSPDGAPVVVGVDDAPLLDDLSTVVVHQIIQRGSAKVVLTVRDDEPVPAATHELWKGGELDHLDVGPLSASATATLVSAVLGGPLGPDVGDRLWALTRGNPLYLRNIVEQEVADGRLAVRDRIWCWHGDAVIPPRLVEVVEARLGGLPDAVSAVLDVLAVGEPIELRSLTRLTAATAVEEADRRGLISFTPGDGVVEVRLAHPLYGEVRRGRAPRTTLRRLRGLVATELAAPEHRDDIHVMVRRGTLSLDSDLPPDVGLLLDAARGAAWMLNLPLADRLSAAAVRAAGGSEARIVRAFVLSCLGSGDEAESLLAEVDSSALSPTDRGRLTFLRAANLLFTLSRPQRARQLVNDIAVESIPEHPSLNASRCVYWAAMGAPAAALECAGRFDLADLPDDFQRRLTMWAIAVAHGEAGHTADAVVTSEAGYPIPVRAFVLIADAHVTALVLAGRVTDAEDVAVRMREQAMTSPGSPFGQAAVAVSAQAALAAGRADRACALLAPVVQRPATWNSFGGFGYRYRIVLTTALAMRGSTEQATAALESLDVFFHPSWRHLDYALAIAGGWVACCHGAVSEAVQIVRTAAETAGRRGQYAAEVLCLQTAAQFGDATTAERLGELGGLVEGPRVELARRFATALGCADSPELESLSRSFEEMGDLVAAVDASAYAAVHFRRQSLRGSALRCSARAEALAGIVRVCTPALQQAVARLPLTDREREIVMLLGEPMSNREIADRLQLSVRTVESHVYNAMAKTGTTCRDELAGLLDRLKRPPFPE
ncbi:LuxR C-terminal-related transcriptional regulator [Mycobacterium sp. ITM-2016-00317]|uniref:LuxR C-terminal-related transcriptional regulator n=1 Tax=Mycobacterium sp. ITM-2016-00317 TaxID=2099694 RepID=UPI00287FABEA|nr:LuxR C-terminal-related transcriptional regulator [Mycobacterium sp. ITM-2016-00317]WNG88306.1 LuxR C-terminal-related transcriptional regulator [Mycobacterium sp. ITM-2016-00317]